VNQISDSLWKITTTAAAVSFTILFLALTFFLRKTLLNERLLRKAESQNLQLAEKLHEAERQLMNTEKLAVMGQLTASFAHEIGTPLGSIQGHLQLLREEVEELARKDFEEKFSERFSILGSQVSKIAQIVKSFLQSTAKPTSQRQLVDLSRIADQTLGIVRPRLEVLGVDVSRQYDHAMGPLRVVPVDLEQILLNLVNNSLDSIASKNRHRNNRSQIQIATGVAQEGAQQWATVSVYDTGVGIRRTDLPNVLKPFFTTKRPGEGTGLGLTICQEIARKYGGRLDFDSREGAWTRVTLRLPYPIEV
jgi:signal transduction histidine kinase